MVYRTTFAPIYATYGAVLNGRLQLIKGAATQKDPNNNNNKIIIIFFYNTNYYYIYFIDFFFFIITYIY